MRLIDADRYRKEWMEMKTFEPMKLLDLQPTAYDTDKVVKELESDERHTFDGCINKRYAIQIVKKGGVDDDDVCEWELTDTRKVMPYKTSCGNEDLYDYSYKYCPYCGKKIKVVE